MLLAPLLIDGFLSSSDPVFLQILRELQSIVSLALVFMVVQALLFAFELPLLSDHVSIDAHILGLVRLVCFYGTA